MEFHENTVPGPGQMLNQHVLMGPQGTVTLLLFNQGNREGEVGGIASGWELQSPAGWHSVITVVSGNSPHG